jgi:clan AA aspartic protease (TIGR02281 family)
MKHFGKSNTLIALIVLLCGCASQNDGLSGRSDDYILDQISKGHAELTCTLGCSLNQGLHRPEFKRLYVERSWRELALKVTALGSLNDQSWFYLGMSAEGLGYNDAAIIYLNHAINVSEKLEPGIQCNYINLINNCDGLTFPNDAVFELHKLTQTVSAAVQNSTYRPGSDAQTQDSNIAAVRQMPAVEGQFSRFIQMKNVGGTYAIPVTINDSIKLDFVVDSGATDVVVPADVILTLMRTGTISDGDFLGKKTYQLADGSTLPSIVFRIRSLKVGNITIENVVGSVAPAQGSLLLGQSFLGRFASWSIDNNRHALLLGAGK